MSPGRAEAEGVCRSTQPNTCEQRAGVCRYDSDKVRFSQLNTRSARMRACVFSPPHNSVHVSADYSTSPSTLVIPCRPTFRHNKFALTCQGVHVCQGGCVSLCLGVCPPVNSPKSLSASICSGLDFLSERAPAGFSIDGDQLHLHRLTAESCR